MSSASVPSRKKGQPLQHVVWNRVTEGERIAPRLGASQLVSDMFALRSRDAQNLPLKAVREAFGE